MSAGGTARLTINANTVGNAWASWTPTFSGAVTAIGTSTINAKYWRVGNFVGFYLRCTFATATFATGMMTITLPVTALAGETGPIGSCVMNDVSAPAFDMGTPVINNTTTMIIRRDTNAAAVTNLVPWTWANGDIIDVQGFYEVA